MREGGREGGKARRKIYCILGIKVTTRTAIWTRKRGKKKTTDNKSCLLLTFLFVRLFSFVLLPGFMCVLWQGQHLPFSPPPLSLFSFLLLFLSLLFLPLLAPLRSFPSSSPSCSSSSCFPSSSPSPSTSSSSFTKSHQLTVTTTPNFSSSKTPALPLSLPPSLPLPPCDRDPTGPLETYGDKSLLFVLLAPRAGNAQSGQSFPPSFFLFVTLPFLLITPRRGEEKEGEGWYKTWSLRPGA